MDKERRKIEINAINKINRALTLNIKGNIFEQIVKETVQEAINYTRSSKQLPSKESLNIKIEKELDEWGYSKTKHSKKVFKQGFKSCFYWLKNKIK